jgi:voltage-gated potassium channel
MRARPSRLYAEPRMPPWWDRSIIGLSALAVVMLLYDLTLPIESELSITLGWVDLVFCSVFVTDFGWRLSRAEQRWVFVKKNWIDLLGSIPFVGPLRAARVVRLVRLLRFLRIAVLVRRIMQRRGWQLPPTVRYIGYASLGIWLAAAGSFWAFESGVNENVGAIDDALWWSITTLSTVGYGDLYPTTLGGRSVALVTMVLGVGVLGMLAGSLATAFVESRDRARKGLGSCAVKEHLLILGWNDTARLLISEVTRDPVHADLQVVVVADLEEAPLQEPHVKFVRGQPMQREALDRAAAGRAAAAVVLALDSADPNSDLRTALAVGALRRLNPTVRISAQLVAHENAELLEQEGCDEIVNVSGFTSTMLARSVQDQGTVALVDDLLSNDGGAQLYRVRIPRSWAGKTVREYGASLIEQRRSLVAVSRGKQLEPVPDPGMRLEAEDCAFVVSHERPGDAT